MLPGLVIKTRNHVYRIIHVYPDGELMYVLSNRRSLIDRLTRKKVTISTHKASYHGLESLVTKEI
jgi:hypothetical protein